MHLRRPGQRAGPGAAGPAARHPGREHRRQLRPAGAARGRHLPDRRRRGPAADAGRPAAADDGGLHARRSAARWCSPSAPATRSWARVRRRDDAAGAGTRAARHQQRPRRASRRRRDRRRRRPGAERARLTGFENHRASPGSGRVSGRWPATVGTGNGDGTEGALRGPGARHLPARPGARPQPGPGRPAAQLGDRPAAAARGRATRNAPSTYARSASPQRSRSNVADMAFSSSWGLLPNRRGGGRRRVLEGRSGGRVLSRVLSCGRVRLAGGPVAGAGLVLGAGASWVASGRGRRGLGGEVAAGVASMRLWAATGAAICRMPCACRGWRGGGFPCCA